MKFWDRQTGQFSSHNTIDGLAKMLFEDDKIHGNCLCNEPDRLFKDGQCYVCWCLANWNQVSEQQKREIITRDEYEIIPDVVYRIDYDKGEPEETHCEKFAYPFKDDDGKTIYKNSHFLSKKEAWEYLLGSYFIEMKSMSEEISQTEAKLQDKNDKLLTATRKYINAKIKYNQDFIEGE